MNGYDCEPMTAGTNNHNVSSETPFPWPLPPDLSLSRSDLLSPGAGGNGMDALSLAGLWSVYSSCLFGGLVNDVLNSLWDMCPIPWGRRGLARLCSLHPAPPQPAHRPLASSPSSWQPLGHLSPSPRLISECQFQLCIRHPLQRGDTPPFLMILFCL
ncbi:hypothetical protein AAFF_G00045520 [Aldrovandia affinis]|uniref:Uncharacterized protein n=1 Tax=Aldrovandia affinis TaxID=143900 RepID=A0AAD7WEY3_9TELE|nr:hypothetical protein AAFF_G00045520 [Aldrovandia affinis]